MNRKTLRGLAALLVLGLPASRSRALEIPLTVVNRDEHARKAEPVSAGIPFARGVLTEISRVRVAGPSGDLPAQFLVTSRWPDGSVRWLLADFQADLPASAGVLVALRTDAEPFPVTPVGVTEETSFLEVDTRVATFHFFKGELALGGRYFEVTRGGQSYRAVPDAGGWQIEERGPVKVVLRVEGRFLAGSAPLVEGFPVGFRARLIFFRDKSDVRLQLTFRNNSGFNWDGSLTRGPSVAVSAITFGTALVPGGGRYAFGPSVEKTWELLVPQTGTPALLTSRYRGDGSLAVGYAPPAPLAQMQPSYVASTGAWGRIALPATGLPAARQADFDLFERIQRAKVIRAELQNPPGLTGITLWSHLSQDLASWNDYGDLRWAGNGCGSFSGNHYDWSYGMYLQYLRTGLLPFADAARVFAQHELDLDLYHTNGDGAAYNHQKDWEDRPSHESPDNCFGGGRPTHTWSQGYALHWLLTGDRRGLDGFLEVQDGVRQYLYESFNDGGLVVTNEIRAQGWLVENLVNLWRVDPQAQITTTCCGVKAVPDAIKDVLRGVYAQEAAAGGKGFVFDGDPADPNLRAPLQHLYFLEPAIKAYEEVLKDRDPVEAARLLGLIRRMTDWLMSITAGGDTNAQGLYRPLQIPAHVDTRKSVQDEYSTAYLLKASNAAALLHLITGETRYRDYARAGFQDFVRYAFVTPGDSQGSAGNLVPSYIDPALRSPASYNSNLYEGTESKVHGWTSRYGQAVLALETGGGSPGGGTAPQASFTFGPDRPAPGAPVAFTDTSTGAPTSWTWSFGDGASSTLQNPTHAYAAAGTYTVSLTASNAAGSSDCSRSLTVEAAGGGSSAVLFVPVVLSAAGLAGSSFTSELTLTNRGSTETLAALDYVATAGGGSGTVTLRLAPGEQRIVPDAIAFLGEQGLAIASSGTRLGTVRVRFSGLSAPGAGSVLVRTTTPVPEGRAGLAYGAVPAARLLVGPAWISGLRQDASDRSNLALMNAGGPSDGDVTLRVTIVAGDPVATLSARPARREAPAGRLLPDRRGPGLERPDALEGLRADRAGRGLRSFLRLRGRERPGQLGRLVLAADPRGCRARPGRLDAARDRGDCILHERGRGDERVLGEEDARPRAGGGHADQRGPHRAARDRARSLRAACLPVLRAEPEGRPRRRGSARGDRRRRAGLRLEPHRRRLGSPRVGADLDTRGRRAVRRRLPGRAAGGAASTAVWLYGLRQDGENRTNLALVNTGEADTEPVRLRVEIFDGVTRKGVAVVEGDSTSVPARGFLQLSRLLAVYAPGVAQGYARISRVSGRNPFVAYAVINDGAQAGLRSGDGAYVGMEVE